jgi:NADH:ubiquinone oxidoreductase subunit 6 (subunit J)
MTTWFFVIFFIIFLLGLLLIFSHNSIYSVLSLLFIVINICLILFSLEFEFLSYIFLIVYIGAVIILL